jgi:DNA-binding transcriptional ArsR family regulator
MRRVYAGAPNSVGPGDPQADPGSGFTQTEKMKQVQLFCNRMVTEAVYYAVADPIRRGILELLRSGERSAGDLARAFAVSRPAVSRHVRVLRHAGLVRLRRDRQTLHYSLNPAPLGEIDRWLSGLLRAGSPGSDGEPATLGSE